MNWLEQKLIEWKATPMVQEVFDKVDGNKTYLSCVLGILVVWAAHFWGPLHYGPIEIPQVGMEAAWKFTWEALTAIFLRHGVAKVPTI